MFRLELIAFVIRRALVEIRIRKIMLAIPEIPEIRPARFHKLGGQDIVVWGTRYTVEADTLAAIDYAIEQLGLEVDSIQTPNESLDQAEYAAFKARGGRG